MDMILYAKWNGHSRFSAFCLSDGAPAGNIINATCFYFSEMDIAKVRLQQIADENKSVGITFQLRSHGKALWQSN